MTMQRLRICCGAGLAALICVTSGACGGAAEAEAPDVRERVESLFFHRLGRNRFPSPGHITHMADMSVAIMKSGQKATFQKEIDEWCDALRVAPATRINVATAPVPFLVLLSSALWDGDTFNVKASRLYVSRIRNMPESVLNEWHMGLWQVTKTRIEPCETRLCLCFLDTCYDGSELNASRNQQFLARLRGLPIDDLKAWAKAFDDERHMVATAFTLISLDGVFEGTRYQPDRSRALLADFKEAGETPAGE